MLSPEMNHAIMMKFSHGHQFQRKFPCIMQKLMKTVGILSSILPANSNGMDEWKCNNLSSRRREIASITKLI